MPRVALVTGSNKGIGYFIAKQLVQKSLEFLGKNLHVIMAGRNIDLTNSSRLQLLQETKADEVCFAFVPLFHIFID
jgi:NAD(P)-dependent dehydrogenase (short-subunit alcohol dehydrogenase family)